jgi:hypothetical protein
MRRAVSSDCTASSPTIGHRVPVASPVQAAEVLTFRPMPSGGAVRPPVTASSDSGSGDKSGVRACRSAVKAR